MRLLMISNDKKILDPTSAVAQRQIEYAKKYEEVHILLRTKSQEKNLAPHLWVYGSYWRYGLARFIAKARGITHITCQDPFENGLIGTLIKRRHPAHLEFQLHTDFDAQSNWRKYLAKYNFTYADHVRVVSERVKNQIKKYVAEEKIEVRPIFVDTEKIKNTPITVDLHKKYPQYKKIVLMVSRIEKEKQIDMAIRAFAQLPDYALVVVGEGSLRENLQKIATPNVYFEGWHDPATYYKTADVFLNTSAFEGYGMTLVEAKSVGLRVLSTDVGVAKEVGAEIITSTEDIVQKL